MSSPDLTCAPVLPVTSKVYEYISSWQVRFDYNPNYTCNPWLKCTCNDIATTSCVLLLVPTLKQKQVHDQQGLYQHEIPVKKLCAHPFGLLGDGAW